MTRRRRVDWITVAIGLILAVAIFLAVAACATKAPELPWPDPVVVTKTVERIVQRNCEDKRPPIEKVPTKEDFAKVDRADPLAIWTLSSLYWRAYQLLTDRLRVDDDQIKACAGG